MPGGWKPGVRHARRFEDIYGRQISALAEKMSEQALVDARERGRGLDLWQTAAEPLEEFSARAYATGSFVVSAS